MKLEPLHAPTIDDPMVHHYQRPKGPWTAEYQQDRHDRENRIVAEPARRGITFGKDILNNPLFVYFIQAESGGAVKIGKAREPRARVTELQCGNPELLVIQAVIVASRTTEGSLHRTFRDYRLEGEWFWKADEILAAAIEASGQQVADYRAGQPMRTVIESAEMRISEVAA
jgi:hypothetical protein